MVAVARRHPDSGSNAILRDLQRIPGVGPSVARDLMGLGIKRVSDLKGRSPERLYRAFERQVGQSVDRCLLYTFRCAVYFAESGRPKPELLKWWNWKDRPDVRAKGA